MALAQNWTLTNAGTTTEAHKLHTCILVLSPCRTSRVALGSAPSQPEGYSTRAGGSWGQQKMCVSKHFISPEALKQCHPVKKRTFVGNSFTRCQALAGSHTVQGTLC